MVKVTPLSVHLKFQGRREYPLAPGIDDWGLNTDQQVTNTDTLQAWFLKRTGRGVVEHVNLGGGCCFWSFQRGQRSTCTLLCQTRPSLDVPCSLYHLTPPLRRVQTPRGVYASNLQESYVEQFRRILLAKNAFNVEEHGEYSTTINF